jgi:hypothetical protein
VPAQHRRIPRAEPTEGPVLDVVANAELSGRSA